MAHAMSIAYVGMYGNPSGVNLNSGSYVLASYTPIFGSQDTVTETAVIEVSGATAALLQTNIHAIERAFTQARIRAAGGSKTRVYVRLTPNNYSVEYQSEILDGWVNLPETILKSDWADLRAEIRVVWTRRNYWEASGWLNVPLTNTNGSNNTSGLNIYNCNDGSGSSPNDRVNYATIAAADVVGNLPAPVKLRMTPSGNIGGVFVSQGADMEGLGSWSTLYSEFESWAGASSTADSNSSGGAYTPVTLNTSWAQELTKSFTGTQFLGMHYRFFIRFPTAPPAGTWVKIRFSTTLNSNIAETTAVLLTQDRLQTIGVLSLPPGGIESDFTSLTIELWAYNASGGTLDLDYLAWWPMQSYVSRRRSDTNVVTGAAGAMIEQSGDIPLSIFENTDETVYPFFDQRSGGGIYLLPGVANILHFGMLNNVSTGKLSAITTYLTVICQYKPRRRTL